MAEVMVQVRDLGKRYRTGEDFQSYDTLRDALERLVRRGRGRRRRRDEIWAVQDVSFEVERGEVLGIVGANGSGKTTVLKLVSRITEPTRGIVRTRGRTGAVLEIGTGFHPELTGAENIRLNAAVLGMSGREIQARLDEIVDFSGVETFLDTPLKRYSTGMRLRLAFAIAAHVEPEILAVDEVLAVGDAEFQRKCLDKMSEMKGGGRTVLFVSHDHGAVTQLCSRAIWLDRGRVRADGEATKVVAEYLGSISHRGGIAKLDVPSAPAFISSIALVEPGGEPLAAVERGEPIELRVDVEASRQVPGLDVGLSILNRRGVRVLDEAWLDGPRPPIGLGHTSLTLTLPGILTAGRYVVGIWVGDSSEAFQEQEALSFDVLPRPDDRADDYRNRIAQPPVRWSAAGP